MEIKAVKELNEKLATFPGISKKQADKMSNFLLNSSDEYVTELIQCIEALKVNIKFCEQCNFIVENGKCLNCDQNDPWNILMVVENPANVKKISELNFFNGYYYVLPYLMNIKGQEDYSYSQLLQYAKDKKIEEVVIVLSPTLEGTMTSEHLFNSFKKNNFKVSKAAIGLPMGSNIEYLDGFTIKQSIENRTK
ncbi:toprim domain-containing protein [Mycoplasmopsis felifaucium]|nr:toprim domain-containing protein [Mycoplasmopsis felifaucium]